MTAIPAVVRTERLVVRDWRDDEAARMLDMYSRPEVVRFLGSSPRPMASLDQARRGIARAREHNAGAPSACGWWAVEVVGSGSVAGTIALTSIEGDPNGGLEISWHLHPDSQHVGYATEAARAVLHRAHALEVPEVLILVAPANAASLAVARRLDVEPLGQTDRYYGMPLEAFVSRARNAAETTSAAATARSAGFDIRAGSLADAPVVLGMFDDAIRWMIERDLTDQWGRQPFSTDPGRAAAVTRWITSGRLLVAEREGQPVGAMVLGDAPDYAPPAIGRELYVVALVAARTPCARGAGRALLIEAEREAAARGVPTLRLDCFAGNDGALVRYYQGAGFSPTEQFTVDEWPGQVLQRTVLRPPAPRADP
jgi:RimJ/RimL family protein N-acetyltransferase/GNAT superfamily N-acetyltransferase